MLLVFALPLFLLSLHQIFKDYKLNENNNNVLNDDNHPIINYLNSCYLNLHPDDDRIYYHIHHGFDIQCLMEQYVD